jgi:hypothetical protein
MSLTNPLNQTSIALPGTPSMVPLQSVIRIQPQSTLTGDDMALTRTTILDPVEYSHHHC